jgi:hypothetical protein
MHDIYGRGSIWMCSLGGMWLWLWVCFSACNFR